MDTEIIEYLKRRDACITDNSTGRTLYITNSGRITVSTSDTVVYQGMDITTALEYLREK